MQNGCKTHLPMTPTRRKRVRQPDPRTTGRYVPVLERGPCACCGEFRILRNQICGQWPEGLIICGANWRSSATCGC
jgi:hypothetical protein